MSDKDKEIFVIVAVVSSSCRLNYLRIRFSLGVGCGFSSSVDVLFLFSQKKNEPKRKVAAGPCCYELAVVRQYLWLPQHCQCCMGRGYVKVVDDSGTIKFILFLDSRLRQTASAKSGQNMMACVVERGIGDFAEGLAMCEREWGKISRPVCSDGLCDMALCIKKPFADEPFDYFLAKK